MRRTRHCILEQEGTQQRRIPSSTRRRRALDHLRKLYTAAHVANRKAAYTLLDEKIPFLALHPHGTREG